MGFEGGSGLRGEALEVGGEGDDAGLASGHLGGEVYHEGRRSRRHAFWGRALNQKKKEGGARE